MNALPKQCRKNALPMVRMADGSMRIAMPGVVYTEPLQPVQPVRPVRRSPHSNIPHKAAAPWRTGASHQGRHFEVSLPAGIDYTASTCTTAEAACMLGLTVNKASAQLKKWGVTAVRIITGKAAPPWRWGWMKAEVEAHAAAVANDHAAAAEHITQPEAMELLGVARNTLRHYVRCGLLTQTYLRTSISGSAMRLRCYYNRGEVEALAAAVANTVSPADPFCTTAEAAGMLGENPKYAYELLCLYGLKRVRVRTGGLSSTLCWLREEVAELARRREAGKCAMPDLREYLTQDEVYKELGITEHRLRDLVEKGHIRRKYFTHAVNGANRRRRRYFVRADVDALKLMRSPKPPVGMLSRVEAAAALGITLNVWDWYAKKYQLHRVRQRVLENGRLADKVYFLRSTVEWLVTRVQK